MAAKYHTPRFILVPALREDLEVLVPADRGPGRTWQAGPALAVVPEPAAGSRPVRIGYARTSMVSQELASQIEALEAAGCTKIFREKISTRVKHRPEMAAALKLAAEFKEAAPDQVVILTVHEMKRLARNATELMQLSADLEGAGILLELLAGPLTGIYDPNGMGSMLFAVLAVAAQLDRNYIREKTLEGQQTAARKGNHGGRPKVIDDDTLTFAVALKDKGTPVPEIAKKLVIKTGKNAGEHPSVASVYRALADAEEAAALAAVDDCLPLRPKPARILRPGEPLTAEEIALCERLVAQRAQLTAADRREEATGVPAEHWHTGGAPALGTEQPIEPMPSGS
ncbi:recombinase family protein [Kitasatospora sp. NBC_01266]|nr:recombinase family protein [Kitasatospora sp. NBC_01266]